MPTITIMEIGGWLRSLGLEQYEAAFHANAVDADALRDLTDQDLPKLGILLGDRHSRQRRYWPLRLPEQVPSARRGRTTPFPPRRHHLACPAARPR
jgi:hypothetical protein